jgi:hypothetical protein
MITRIAYRWIRLGLLSLALVAPACTDVPDTVLINDQGVNIARGNGTVDVMFRGLIGQRVLITLTGPSTASLPFALLTNPGGGLRSAPPVTSVVDGVNSAEVNLNEMGTYLLTIHDGSGLGGTIVVRVELI